MHKSEKESENRHPKMTWKHERRLFKWIHNRWRVDFDSKIFRRANSNGMHMATSFILSSAHSHTCSMRHYSRLLRTHTHIQHTHTAHTYSTHTNRICTRLTVRSPVSLSLTLRQSSSLCVCALCAQMSQSFSWGRSSLHEIPHTFYATWFFFCWQFKFIPAIRNHWKSRSQSTLSRSSIKRSA